MNQQQHCRFPSSPTTLSSIPLVSSTESSPKTPTSAGRRQCHSSNDTLVMMNRNPHCDLSLSSSVGTPVGTPLSATTPTSIYYKIQPCSKCWKKAEEYQESTCYCNDCGMFLCRFHMKTHIKKFSNHEVVNSSISQGVVSNRVPPLNISQSPISSPISSARKKPPKCVLHSIPINTFCKTCQGLICASCSVESHRGHDIYLIENIEEEEKVKLRRELSELEKNVIEWEVSHGLEPDFTKDDCKFYLQKLEEMKEQMKSQSDKFFSNIQQVVLEKHEKLNQSIDDICREYELILNEVSVMKKEMKLLHLEFTNIKDMTGYEILDKKLRKYYKTCHEFEHLKLNFKCNDVADLYENQLMDTREIVNDIRLELDQFSSIANVMKRRVIPRTLQYSHTLEQPENEKNQMANPYDLKISYALNVILVSDYFNSRIQVYDLTSKKLKSSIKTFFRPHCLCMEEELYSKSSPKDQSKESQSFIIIGSNERSIYKFNLEQLLKISQIDKQSQFYIWKQSGEQISYPSGMAICKLNKMLYVCDYNNNCIHLVNPQSGQLLHKLDQSTCCIRFQSPWGIDTTHYGDLIVSEVGSNRIQIFKVSSIPESPLATGLNFKNSYQIELKCSFGKTGSLPGEFNFVRGLLFDRASRQIFVCDFSNRRIEIFDEMGSHLQSYKFEAIQGPYGICLNEASIQELLVADYSKKKVHVLNVS